MISINRSICVITKKLIENLYVPHEVVFCHNFSRVRKLRKTASCVVTVCLSLSVPPSLRPCVCVSVRMKQLISHWTDFHTISYLNVFRKSVEKIHVSLQFDKNNWYFTYRPMYNYESISLRILLK